MWPRASDARNRFGSTAELRIWIGIARALTGGRTWCRSAKCLRRWSSSTVPPPHECTVSVRTMSPFDVYRLAFVPEVNKTRKSPSIDSQTTPLSRSPPAFDAISAVRPRLASCLGLECLCWEDIDPLVKAVLIRFRWFWPRSSAPAAGWIRSSATDIRPRSRSGSRCPCGTGPPGGIGRRVPKMAMGPI